jgi:cysteine desulfurase/selenocysteine lyase
MNNVRKDFPILTKKVNGHPLVYFDNAATTQKPYQVIHAMVDFLEHYNGNPHRGAHTLSIEATELYDQAREAVARFINARSSDEIIFVRNTTEALNLVARSYGEANLHAGDKIVIPISEHHSDLVPWQRVASVTGARLVYMYLDDEGHFTEEDLNKIDKQTKVVAFAAVSNVLGMKRPIEKIVKRAHEAGAVVVLDGAQSAPHMKSDVQKWDCDFYAFSGHKMLGSAGTGVLYGKKELLDAMEPFLSGGDMIEYVQEQSTTFEQVPFKFEAGTENVEGAVALHAAIDYLESIGFEAIEKHEYELTKHCMEGLMKLPYIHLLGSRNPEEKVGVISFIIDGVHPHDAATILDSYGIAIRSGHHCAQPLAHHLHAEASNRVSFYIYNTLEEVDYFLDKLPLVRKQMGFKD